MSKKDFVEMPKEAVNITAPCKWAKVFEPDTRFNPDGEYSIDLVLPADEFEPIKTVVENVLSATRAKVKPALAKRAPQSMGYKEELDDETGDETGYVIIKAKKRAKTTKGKELKVSVFDQFTQPVTNLSMIPNGSVVVARVSFTGYEAGSNWGVTAKLEGIQIVKIASYEGASASDMGFKPIEGAVRVTEEQEEAVNDGEGDGDF